MTLALQSDWSGAAEQPDLARRALAAADQGVALAAELPESWARRAMLRLQLRWDWEGARADLDRALALNHRDVTANAGEAWLLTAQGKVAQGIAAARRVVDLDPLFRDLHRDPRFVALLRKMKLPPA
jgi:tetratricopeptide (TPR) repeat protein